MSWDVELAKEIKARDNKEPNSPIIGDVVSLTPLKISIYNNKAILTNSNTYLCSSLTRNIKKADITLDRVAEHGTISTTGNITYKDILNIGDRVLCLPTEDGQKFFIVDKVI